MVQNDPKTIGHYHFDLFKQKILRETERLRLIASASECMFYLEKPEKETNWLESSGIQLSCCG